jgi:hypothetical protein
MKTLLGMIEEINQWCEQENNERAEQLIREYTDDMVRKYNNHHHHYKPMVYNDYSTVFQIVGKTNYILVAKLLINSFDISPGRDNWASFGPYYWVNNTPMIKWMYSYFPDLKTRLVDLDMGCMVEWKDINFVEWLIDNDIRTAINIYKYGIFGSWMECVEYAMDYMTDMEILSVKLRKSLIDYVPILSVNVVKKLVDRDIFSLSEINHIAVLRAEDKSLHLLEKIRNHSEFSGIYDQNLVINYAGVDCDIIQTIYQADSCKKHTEIIFANICSTGNIQRAEWFMNIARINKRGLAIAVASACKHNHLDMAKWLFQKNPKNIDTHMLASACHNNNLPMLEWLWDNFQGNIKIVPLRIAYSNCSMDGYLEIIKWLDIHMPEIKDKKMIYDCCQKAAINNHVDTMIYFKNIIDKIHDNKYRYEENWPILMKSCIIHGSFETAEWLYHNIYLDYDFTEDWWSNLGNPDIIAPWIQKIQSNFFYVNKIKFALDTPPSSFDPHHKIIDGINIYSYDSCSDDEYNDLMMAIRQRQKKSARK